MSEPFIAKDLEMASSLWVVWSSGVTCPAAGEVTQLGPVALSHCLPGLASLLPQAPSGLVFWTGQSWSRLGGGQGQTRQAAALCLLEPWRSPRLRA